MRRGRLVPVLLLAATATALAQSAVVPDGPTFDAVSIKPNTSNRPANGVIQGFLPGGRLRLVGLPIVALIMQAYPAPTPDYIVGLPDWATRDRYDVMATSALQQPAREQRVAMIRAMLADRLKLAAHVEKRPRDVFTLVLAHDDGRLGSNLARATLDCPAILAQRRAEAAARPPGSLPPAPKDDSRLPCTTRMGRGSATASLRIDGDAPIETLRMYLQAYAHRPVIDHTGLAGTFTFSLEFDSRTSYIGPDIAPAAGAAPSIFTAVEEQLGLKLVSAREELDTVVVDHIERPSEN